MSTDVDVVIIGAGAAGIASAIELQSTNLNVLILEARDRIGGRAYTDEITFQPTPIDLGASWIHSSSSDNIIYNYYNELKTNDKTVTRGYHTCYDYDGGNFSSDTVFQARRLFMEIDEQLEAFTNSKDNTEDQSVEQLIQLNNERLQDVDEPVKRLLDLFFSAEEQYEASNMKYLSAKYRGIGSGSGCDQWVAFGYGNLLQRIANKHNLSFRLNTVVTHIDTTDNDRIAIRTENEATKIYCRRIILTVPLGCLKRETIQFEPPLPDWKLSAIHQMGCGLMNKLIVQFPQSFWSSQLGGFSYACKERRGRFRFTIIEPSPANIFILFVTGDFARELEKLTDVEILQEIMKFLRQIFPTTTIPEPTNYKFTRWGNDPLTYGSYSNFAVHSGPHTIEALSKETSDGRVQWAGEHANPDDGTSDWSFACVHTAFQSGQRAARTIRNQLCSS